MTPCPLAGARAFPPGKKVAGRDLTLAPAIAIVPNSETMARQRATVAASRADAESTNGAGADAPSIHDIRQQVYLCCILGKAAKDISKGAVPHDLEAGVEAATGRYRRFSGMSLPPGGGSEVRQRRAGGAPVGQVVRRGACAAVPRAGFLHRRGHWRVRQPGVGHEVPRA